MFFKTSVEPPTKLSNEPQAKQNWKYTGAPVIPKLSRKFAKYGSSVKMVHCGNNNIVIVCEKMIP